MEKKYKNSLCLMKAYPPTLGHLYLINTAIENSEKVYVMVCHNKTQWIPGEIRYKAIQEVYKDNANVIVLSCEDDGLPQHENECKNLDEFYSYWVPFVYKYVEKLDAVFTSEDYGDDFAKYLGIEHFQVDKSRNKYKISGTEVRNNPIKNWDFIISPMKYFFVKRIVIMGPESVGKSTLTEKLAKYYETNFVEEYGRTVFEENGNSISIDDFIKISEGRQKLEDDLIKSSNKFIFCDTEDITTYLFSKLFYPNDYEKIETYFLDKIKFKKNYHLYILLKPDCDGVQDGTRCFLEEREQHYQMIKAELIKNNCDFVEIGGDWDNRYEESIKTINKKIIYSV